MEIKTNRRDMLGLLSASGVGVVFSSALAGCDQRDGAPPKTAASAAGGEGAPKPRMSPYKDFFFVQITDTHWGYKGAANPESDVSLKKLVALINSSTRQPDFIIFTGDLTHTTDDAAERRKRLGEFKAMVSELKCKNLKLIPGEHDGSLDQSAAFKEFFGETNWTFDYEGVHFLALDNVSDIDGGLGEKQLAWLEADLAKLPPDMPVVVFSHRPLFTLQQQWEWWTKDGGKAVQILMKRKNVTCFYGHIHQEHHYMTGHIAHHAARSMIFQLPQAGSVPKRAPLPWKPENPDKGLGFRQVVVGNDTATASMNLTDFNSVGGRLPPWTPTPILMPIPPIATAETAPAPLAKK